LYQISYNFVHQHTAQKHTWSSPTVIIGPKGVQHNLICISMSYTLFSMIFRLSRHFLGILLNRKEKKRNPTLDRGSGPRPQCRGTTWVGGLAQPLRWPTVHARNARACTTGHGHHGWSQCGGVGGHGWLTAPLLRGRVQGHKGGGRGAPGKRNNNAAHRGGRASVRRRGETDTVVFRRWTMAHEG
jgi:hypothetical protein